MIAAKCKKCGYIGCNGDNSLCNSGDRFIYTGLEEYLKDTFTPCDCYSFKSKKKRLGAGTGDDANLYIYASPSSTSLWWQENRGFEKTIFEGRKLKSIEELETVFDLLDLKEFIVERKVLKNTCHCGRGERENGEHYCKNCLNENPLLCT